MDSTKLLNWKLLNGIAADAAAVISFADLSNAFMTGKCTLSSCNIDKSVFATTKFGLLSLTLCEGAITINIDPAESSHPIIFDQSKLLGSRFILPEEPSRPFLGSNATIFKGSTFELFLSPLTNTMEICGTSSLVISNDFSGSNFNHVILSFTDLTVGTLATNNKFDFCSFNGGGILMDQASDVFNSNTFKNCTFNNSTITLDDTEDSVSLDFTLSTFTKCDLNLFKNQLIAGCTFNNCYGDDSSVESLIANSTKLSSDYTFMYNGKKYTVEAV